jgi:hypothetical protein
MGFVVSGFALAILVVGALGLASPEALMSFVRRWKAPLGIWMAAGIRVAFGIALWLAAPSSRVPAVLQILAAVAVMVGIALPLLGLSRFEAILSWWERRSVRFKRAWAGVACAFGGFLLWSVIV